ncbi:hypothetical protein [Pseudescherichia sp.]|uniref:hypothetical protein n=1 Tax=Pseudescherichia sp. TaxID=2055881 RepID=UPI0028A2562E|nr:hypothetical protein [Pseudescherichia sp.]
MSNKINGGPAFPHVRRSIAPGIEEVITDGGMSLRDYFAAKALQGWLSTYGDSRSHPVFSGTVDTVAENAYLLADAMLRAREAS